MKWLAFIPEGQPFYFGEDLLTHEDDQQNDDQNETAAGIITPA
jgi:hypothetical protein